MPHARDVAVGGVKIAGLVAAVWVGLIIADLLTFYLIYSKATATLILFGAMGEEGANIMGLLFAVFVTVCFHGLSVHLLLRRRRALFAMVVVAIAWFGMVGIVKAPYMADALFNGQGVAIYKYAKMPDGTIVKYPKGLTHDPKTNRPLAEFNTATADEYLAQEAKPKAKPEVKPEAKKEEGFFDWLFGKSSAPQAQAPAQIRIKDVWHDRTAGNSQDYSIVVRVEKIQLDSNQTILICSTEPQEAYGYLTQRSPDKTYMTDDKGRPYNLIQETVSYENYKIDPGPFSRYEFYNLHKVRPGESYSYALHFTKLSPDVQALRLYYLGVVVDISSLLANIEKLPPPAVVAEAPKPKPEPPAPPPATPTSGIVPIPLALSPAEPSGGPSNDSDKPEHTPLSDDPTTYALSIDSELKKFRVVDRFTRVVKVNRYRRHDEVFKLPNWNLGTYYCDTSNIPSMSTEEVRLQFFRIEPDEILIGEDFARVYEVLGLRPDPYATAAANESDPTLAKRYPNFTQWKSPSGKSYIEDYQTALFRQKDYRTPDHLVYCGLRPMAWSDIGFGAKNWWASGVSK